MKCKRINFSGSLDYEVRHKLAIIRHEERIYFVKNSGARDGIAADVWSSRGAFEKNTLNIRKKISIDQLG